MASAEAGDQTALVELLLRSGLRHVAGLHVRHRLTRRAKRGRPPGPPTAAAVAAAEAIRRRRHLARWPIARRMSVAEYAHERWGVRLPGVSHERLLDPHGSPSEWSAIITTEVGPAAVQAVTIDQGGSRRAREALAVMPELGTAIDADSPAKTSAELKPDTRGPERGTLAAADRSEQEQ